MNVKSLSGGFTLIELLVVISIIGLLSSVVLASLNTARAKGADAAIKADLAGIRSSAELYLDDNSGSYAPITSYTMINCKDNLSGNLFESTGSINRAIGHATSLAGGTVILPSHFYTLTSCAASPTSYAAAVALKTSTTGSPKSWCVDSSGSSRQVNSIYSSAILGDGTEGDPYRCS